MERSTAILAALIAYLVALLALGVVAQRRTRDNSDFYLGGKSLGPWVAALAANASSSSAWSLVGTSGFAYQNGLAALWLIPGCVGGFVLNWWLVAPRLRAQMQAAGSAFTHAFDSDLRVGVLIGAGVTVAYTLLGGYLAASITDTLQGLLMVVVALVVPIGAVAHLGGVAAATDAVAAIDAPGYHSLFAGREGVAAFAFAFGLVGIGLGYPGQPHAVNKFMGMAPGASMTVARTVGISWAVLLYGGMLVLGWAGRAAWQLPAGSHEDVLYEASAKLFPPLVDGVILASVLAAIMSTVDSQLLVCASSVTHDLGLRPATERGMLRLARATVLAIGVAATATALVLPKNVFDNVMFAWAALGSAFGPLLLVRLLRGPVRPGYALGAMCVGGLGAIGGFYAPLVGKGFDDRVLSWTIALAVAWLGVRRAGSVLR
jgi:Na+/proline symporter